MDIYTLDRNFLKESAIDAFSSAIWTERYYGDSEFELVVPASREMIQKLPEGKFLWLEGSKEVMILETTNLEDGKLKTTGISLLKWMNNRFVRTSSNHEDKYWYLNSGSAGWTLWAIIYYMCHASSPYLNGEIDTGIPNPERFAIPGLNLVDYDTYGDNINVAIPYGPVYDAMKDIATTYQVGIQIILISATSAGYAIGFRSYRGADRTSKQNVNPVVLFSPQLDSFTDTKELKSIAALKTDVYVFAPGLRPAEGDPY